MKRRNDHRSSDSNERVTADLVERCKLGDEQAWAQLVEETHRGVYTLCLRILGDPDDAKEATQDAYLKAWRGLKSFRGDAAFETWLYRVASNAALSKHRGRRRRRVHESGVDDEVLTEMAAPGSVEAEAGAKVEVKALESALSTLPEHYRSAVVLRDVYGLGIEEIAGHLGISETAAKVRVHRGRKKLKDLIYGDENDGVR
jgi:RNA polymerase sigma-70 factor, ECF subfamily